MMHIEEVNPGERLYPLLISLVQSVPVADDFGTNCDVDWAKAKALLQLNNRKVSLLFWTIMEVVVKLSLILQVNLL